MSVFQVGYAEVNINPPLGIGIAGYYIPRFVKGFLDDLKASALALSLGDTKVLLISVDNEGITKPLADKFRAAISERAEIPGENVFLSVSHTHTGPLVEPTDAFPAPEAPIAWYQDFMARRLGDVAALALADLKPGKMGFAVGTAPDRIAYIRRYKMKDGTTMTCPPVGDPNIDHPIGTLDQRVNVLRFDREGAESVVLVNYGLHADTINGELISADFPGWMRRTVEKALDGTKCIFFNGAEGDVGSTHVFPDGGDMNDTEISFDNEMKSPGMARFIGRALAGTVLQVYDKVEYLPVKQLAITSQEVVVAANVPDPAALPLAHKYKELHDAGRDDLIPYTSIELTTVVAEAMRMCRLEHGPREFRLWLTGVRIGDIAMVGIPGEPFTGIGVAIKEAPDWKCILPCGLTNGQQGYFPLRDAFDEGGYEARSSVYTGDVADDIIRGAHTMLERMRENSENSHSITVGAGIQQIGR